MIAAGTPFADPLAEARRLGAFLRALHVPAASDAPPNPYRGHFVGEGFDFRAVVLDAAISVFIFIL